MGALHKGIAKNLPEDMDVLREAFSYPFMELAHPTGRKKLVSKERPQAGAAYGIELAGLLCPQ